jgi:hypothetical protein
MARALMRPRKTSLRIMAGIPPNREIIACIGPPSKS